ncbi:hypothetical protein E4U54_004938 [Claviceps lovelessii]|nr:hypothetical protein E4U54_004938 [Claviceps lovelessii]
MASCSSANTTNKGAEANAMLWQKQRGHHDFVYPYVALEQGTYNVHMYSSLHHLIRNGRDRILPKLLAEMPSPTDQCTYMANVSGRNRFDPPEMVPSRSTEWNHVDDI